VCGHPEAGLSGPTDDPDLRSTDNEDHRAACFYGDEAKEEIEYQLEVEE
jgi:hypothetical protein